MSEEINRDVIDQLIELEDGDSSFAAQMINEYFEQLIVKIDELTDLAFARNYTAVGKLGHYLKGSSACVGAMALADICEEIQNFGSLEPTEENDTKLLAHLSHLANKYPMLHDQMLAYINKH